MIKRIPTLTIAAILLASGMGTAWAANAAPVDVARQGHALHHVVISPEASQTSRIAAEELADYLGRISGSIFTIEEGDGTTGLPVGAFDEFSELKLDVEFDPSDPFNREQYRLRSHADGIHLVGFTSAAARLAVWDLLYRLGHRQFFPTDHWEVIPSQSEITVAVDVIDKPDYVHRRIYPGGSRWSYAEPLWTKWRIRNRNESGASFSLSTGHIYGSIIRNNRQAFDENPEYFAVIDGEHRDRGSHSKFCISNDDLRKLVVDHNVRVIQAEPDRQSVSMDPSDGGPARCL